MSTEHIDVQTGHRNGSCGTNYHGPRMWKILLSMSIILAAAKGEGTVDPRGNFLTACLYVIY